MGKRQQADRAIKIIQPDSGCVDLKKVTHPEGCIDGLWPFELLRLFFIPFLPGELPVPC